MLEEACSRAGIPPERLSAEIVYKALDQLNLLVTEMLNRGIQLWRRQQLILPLYENYNQVPLPPGYNLVTTLNRRVLSRQTTGTPFSDAGGDATLAFDDDFDTTCLQTSPNGSIGIHFDSPTNITQCGVLSGTTGNFVLFFEWSNDNVEWHALEALPVVFGSERQWLWTDLQGSPPGGASYWRVRSVGSVPFGAEEIFFGNTPSEVYLTPWNIDDYSNMPNKFQPGTVVNYYQQRDLTEPVLYVWMSPDHSERYTTLVVWATEYLSSVTDINQPLDFPSRWYEAVTAMMAVRICRTMQEADFSRMEYLVPDAAQALSLAQAEERDPSPVNYDTGLQYYTSGD
jgi:hypothetical protein